MYSFYVKRAVRKPAAHWVLSGTGQAFSVFSLAFVSIVVMLRTILPWRNSTHSAHNPHILAHIAATHMCHEILEPKHDRTWFASFLLCVAGPGQASFPTTEPDTRRSESMSGERQNAAAQKRNRREKQLGVVAGAESNWAEAGRA